MTIGIYKITCLVNGKFYIGSSVNIETRFKEHQRDLRKGNHCNIKLLRAYNKYGENCFTYEILEKFIACDLTLLRQIEQGYLNIFSPFKEVGFNTNRSTKCSIPSSIKSKNFLYFLIDPNGQLFYNFKFINRKKVVDKTKPSLRKLAEELGIPNTSLNAIARGNYKNYKGWTNSFYNHQVLKRYGTFRCLRGKPPVKYRLKNSMGKEAEFFNITTFAKENNLQEGNVSLLLRRKYNYCKDWFDPERFLSLEEAKSYSRKIKEGNLTGGLLG